MILLTFDSDYQAPYRESLQWARLFRASADKTATTDAVGAFLLSGVNAGAARPLMVDGRTASAPNRKYSLIMEPAAIVAGQANIVPYTFYLPAIDTQYEVDLIPGQNTTAANPRVPGLNMTIPAGANLRNRDGSPVARVSITPLAIDRTPAPLPSNVGTNLVYTSQPGGARLRYRDAGRLPEPRGNRPRHASRVICIQSRHGSVLRLWLRPSQHRRPNDRA